MSSEISALSTIDRSSVMQTMCLWWVGYQCYLWASHTQALFTTLCLITWSYLWKKKVIKLTVELLLFPLFWLFLFVHFLLLYHFLIDAQYTFQWKVQSSGSRNQIESNVLKWSSEPVIVTITSSCKRFLDFLANLSLSFLKK